MNDFQMLEPAVQIPDTQCPTVQSVQVGRVMAIDEESGKQWKSAIAKSKQHGPVWVSVDGLEGDEQADIIHHGGADKAVLAYSADHYPMWRQELGKSQNALLCGGGFGENLTIDCQAEQQLCIGDIVEIGSCRLQVSQPRQPCWKLSKRWGISKLAVTVQKTGRTGWYYRVLSEGHVQAGDHVRLIARSHPNWTVSNAHAVMHAKPRNRKDDLALADCAELSKSWREQLCKRATRQQNDSMETRLFGTKTKD